MAKKKKKKKRRRFKPANPEKIIQSTMRLTESLWERVHTVAYRKGISMQKAITEAVIEFVERSGVDPATLPPEPPKGLATQAMKEYADREEKK